MYRNGTGVPQDYAEAVRWYRLAADQGYAMAQFNLGLMYTKGEGVPPDLVLAHVWFNLSAAQGGIAGGQANRDIAASLMTPDQIAEAERWRGNGSRWPNAELRSSTACITTSTLATPAPMSGRCPTRKPSSSNGSAHGPTRPTTSPDGS